MSYPIIEFDPERKAFIEPSKVVSSKNIALCCVPCFFLDVLEKVIVDYHATVVASNKWEDGLHHIYEIDYRGSRLAFYHPGIGSAQAAGLLEEVIALGCRKFVACGGCGVLETQLTLGHLICISAAVRDEGASYHYLPPSREVQSNQIALDAIVKLMNKEGIPFTVGKTWSTDAPYRETRDRIVNRRREGCITVEMEAAGMMAVAQFRNVLYGQILYGGDDLSGSDWDKRDWQNRLPIRERLFWISADAVLSF